MYPSKVVTAVPKVNVAPTPAVPFEYVADKFAVVAASTEFLTSKPCDTESTYALFAKELSVNPARSLYPAGTVTVPVEWGDNSIFLFEAVVEIVWPLIVMSSTTKEVIPAISVVVEPKVSVELPNVIVEFANFTFVTPASVNCVVPIELLPIENATWLFVTAVTTCVLPWKSKVSFVLNVSVPVSPVIVKLE